MSIGLKVVWIAPFPTMVILPKHVLRSWIYVLFLRTVPNPNAFLILHSLAEDAATKTNLPSFEQKWNIQKSTWKNFTSKVLLTAFASTGITPMTLLATKISIRCILANHLNGLAGNSRVAGMAVDFFMTSQKRSDVLKVGS